MNFMKMVLPCFLLFTMLGMKGEPVKNDLDILFKGRVKVNCPTSERERLNRFFGDVLGQKIEVHDNFDRIHFSGGGFVAFVYHDDPEMVLASSDFLKAMQVGLLVRSSHYQQAVQWVKTFGVSEVFPEKDQSTYYYFHAPGGQVFRFVNTPDADFDREKG